MNSIRKPSAKYAKYKFLEKWNDVIFFIEDTDKSTKKVFMEILKNLFDDKSIESVFPLGGRFEVVEQCRKSQNEGRNEKAIYIIDGDLYLLSGENKDIYGNIEGLKKLFVLSRYCIENYLIEKTSVLELLDEEECEKTITELESLLQYDHWINDNNELFMKLYVCYSIAQKIELGVPLINYKISKLVSSNKGTLDHGKINERCIEIENMIIPKIGMDLYNDYRNEILSNVNLTDFTIKYVSGKDHLFLLLLTRMKSITKMSASYDTYKVRLAKKCNSSDLFKLLDFYNDLYA